MSDRLQALFARLPLERSMSDLVPNGPVGGDLQALAESASEGLAPDLQAAVWLYVDDLDRSHRISQGIDGPTGAYWHGIMHRREGDFSNAKYWFRQVGKHPGIEAVGYDPVAFVEDCASRHRLNPDDLVALQRREWKCLFDWCLTKVNE